MLSMGEDIDAHSQCGYTIRILLIQSGPVRMPVAKRRKAVNVTVDQQLLSAARQHKLNLSKLLEDSLLDELKRRDQHDWLERNQDAIDAYNERIRKHGVFSDGLRRF
jgi:antitoxin CcdA